MARINLEVTTSRWNGGYSEIGIRRDIRNKFDDHNFFITSENYEVTLFIDYKEKKGEIYRRGGVDVGHKTIIQCKIKLIDNKGNLLYEEFIFC